MSLFRSIFFAEETLPLRLGKKSGDFELAARRAAETDLKHWRRRPDSRKQRRLQGFARVCKERRLLPGREASNASCAFRIPYQSRIRGCCEGSPVLRQGFAALLRCSEVVARRDRKKLQYTTVLPTQKRLGLLCFSTTRHSELVSFVVKRPSLLMHYTKSESDDKCILSDDRIGSGAGHHLRETCQNSRFRMATL